jgi:hypothetical protein
LSALLKQQSRRRSAANGFAFVPHVPLSWAAIVVVEPAVGNPTDARFGKRNNVPMRISFPLSPPIFLRLAFHRWRIRILYFQPKRRAAPTVNRAELLGDNTFTAEPTSLAEYRLAGPSTQSTCARSTVTGMIEVVFLFGECGARGTDGAR